jgi:hypothetical protein
MLARSRLLDGTPTRPAAATRLGVDHSIELQPYPMDPSRELHRAPAPWITTATRLGVDYSMELVSISIPSKDKETI